MPWWIVGLSLFAASISSTTLIGQSGDAYHTGVAVFNYNLTGVVVMVFFATFLLPLYIRSGIFTIPEFLERRFDKRSRYYFSGICIVGNIFLDAAGALYAAALIIKLLFPEADLQLIIIIFAVLAASYTIPGGLSSAINAELIQAVILIVGSVILTGACFANGGFDYLASLFESGDMSVRLIRPLTDTATPWLGLIVGMPVLGIYFWANNQTLVQRVLSARSVDEGRKGVMFAGALTLATLFIIVFPGVIARPSLPGHRETRHDLSDDGAAPAAHRVAGNHAFGAARRADVDAERHSELHVDALHDGFLRQDRQAGRRTQAVRVGKLASLVIIVIAALWAPQIGRFGSLLKYYQEMLSYIAPPVVAAFLMGVFSRRANGRGAFAGLIAGLVVAAAMLLWRTEIFGGMHFLLIVPFLLVFSLSVIWAVSRTAPAPQPDKLIDTTFSAADFRAETRLARGGFLVAQLPRMGRGAAGSVYAYSHNIPLI